MSLTKDLREFVECLNSNGVEYLIVGALAVSWHGYPRYSADVDFFVNASPANAARVLAAIQQFGFGSLGLTLGDFTAPARVIQLGHEPNRIDLMTPISGVSFDDAWQSRAAGELDGIPVHFIGRRVGSLPLPRGSHGFLLDMSAVEDMDSAGLGELVILYTTVGAKGGRLGLVNPSQRIVHLLDTTRLAGILTHFETSAAAAAWLADPAKDRALTFSSSAKASWPVRHLVPSTHQSLARLQRPFGSGVGFVRRGTHLREEREKRPSEV